MILIAKKRKQKTGKSKTPSFIIEMPLVVNTHQKKTILSRMEAGRQLYNACLGEALKRKEQMIRSRLYRQAKTMPGNTESEKAARSAVFKEARKKYRFSEYALHGYATRIRNSWIGEHLDSQAAQKIASRAYQAVEKTLTGEAERVRFKRYGELNSIEGKSNSTGIRWRNNRVIWNGLELKPLINSNDPVIKHGLDSRVKYVRIVKRIIGGKIRFFVQLICEGTPYQKPQNQIREGIVGLDIGPSTIARISETEANLSPFCPELESQQKEIKQLQRKLDRQRRANNPDNYNPDGTIKKGHLKWRKSKRYLKTQNQHAEIHRKQAEYRKSLHGKMINEILRTGNRIYLEALSYKSFQKNFGKTVNFRGPGTFVARLKQKTERTGEVIEFPAGPTSLSQTCQCGKKEKKTLAKRWHQCECGVKAQRDLYSAYLARYVDQDKTGKWQVDLKKAQTDWPKYEPMLTQTIKNLKAANYYKPTSMGI
ncbi:MAG: RNA-guided endonuclease TnpB family protein [Bacillota bacterium]